MIDATVSLLEKVLDLRSQAHAVHASNIANANVPNYKAKNIDFQNQLREAIRHLDHPEETQIRSQKLTQHELTKVAAEIYEDPLAPMRGDGNTVNPDREQAEIAKNTLAYQTAVQLLNKKLAMQKYVLSEGGRV